MFVFVNLGATCERYSSGQLHEHPCTSAKQRAAVLFLVLTSSLFTFVPSHMEALIRVRFDPDGLKRNTKYVHTYKIKYKIRKKKERFRNAGGLILPKSAGLFLINLDDVLVLHPQLFRSLVVCDSLSFEQKP